jgi:hypothetical protein
MRNTAAVFLSCLVLGGYGMLPARADCAPPKFIVFFSDRSAELPAVGKAIVKTAAAGIEKNHPISVLIAADTGGSTGLSESRFAAVRKVLIDEGVSPKMIVRTPIRGPRLIETGTANDRVEIRLLSGGASSGGLCATSQGASRHRNRVVET